MDPFLPFWKPKKLVSDEQRDLAHSRARLRRATPLGPARRLAAFSLLELLVVIAIVGILSSVAVISFTDIGRAASGRGAADLAASMALSARVEAMSHGHGALLVIDDSNDPQRKYQRMAVFRFTNAEGPPVLAGRVTPLPRGTFFLPGYSTWNALVATNLDVPGKPGTSFRAIRYNGSGHLVEPQTVRMVFAPGIMDSAGNLQNPTNMLAGRQGFLLRRNGRPVFFNSPDEMTNQ